MSEDSFVAISQVILARVADTERIAATQ